MSEKSLQPQQQVLRFSFKIGAKNYQAETSPEMLPVLRRVTDKQEPIVTTTVRGKETKFYLVNQFSLWTAFCTEDIEPDLLDWIDSMPNDAVFYDLGASTGPFAVYAAKCGLKVFAFEPDAQNYALLEMNNFLNAESFKYPLIALNVAISNEYGLGKLFYAEYRMAAHQKILDKPKLVQESENFVPSYIQPVVKYPLDKLIAELKLAGPEYIKIDVDGVEKEVLEGAQETLKSAALKSIFIELEEGVRGKEVINMIESFGFCLSSRKMVEAYHGLHNYIFVRD